MYKVIITKNTQTKQIMPMLQLVDNIDETKKMMKKQLINNILEDPVSTKAYLNLECIQIAMFDIKKGELIVQPKKTIIKYNEMFNDIIEKLTQEGLEKMEKEKKE